MKARNVMNLCIENLSKCEKLGRTKLNGLYREIPMKDADFRSLRKYFSAAANLYGAVSLKQVWQIVEGQNADKFDADSFKGFAKLAMHESEGYELIDVKALRGQGKEEDILEYLLVDAALLEEPHRLEELVEAVMEQPTYYLPKTKKGLLSFAEADYVEKTKPLDALLAALEGQKEEEQVMEALTMLSNQVRKDIVEGQDASSFLKEKGLQADEDLVFAFVQNLRKQSLQGFSTVEKGKDNSKPAKKAAKSVKKSSSTQEKKMAQSSEKKAESSIKESSKTVTLTLPNAFERKLRQELWQAQRKPAKVPVRSFKVGRNEPCICGSGKKYKNCCGKKNHA